MLQPHRIILTHQVYIKMCQDVEERYKWQVQNGGKQIGKLGKKKKVN